MNKQTKSGKKISIKVKLILLAVLPAFVVTVGLLIFARISLADGINNEVLSGLKMTAQATKAGFNQLDSGDYKLDEDGKLWKGNTNLSVNMSKIDEFTKGYEADVTICYGKTRKITSLVSAETGERIVETDVADEVWETVKNGEIYTTTDIVINNKDYAACYIPIEDRGGNIVGMVFAGQPTTEITGYINSKVINIIIIGVIILAVAAIIGLSVAGKISKCLSHTNKCLGQLAEGNLNVQVDASVTGRNDEIGEMAFSLEGLIERLRNIVSNLKKTADTVYQSGNSIDDMASQSSTAADEISRAVEDISKGAVSQAEEISDASMEVTNIEKIMEQIVDNVKNLKSASDSMGEAGNVSMDTMGALSYSNDKTTAAIGNIGEQIDLTNDSVGKISEAATLITNITTQTKLLALNASIESARAGEAGKGFAVVATEIQNLAAQSESAAGEIQRIIDALSSESAKTMSAMKETKSLVNEQQQKLEDTKTSFKQVSSGIEVSKEGTERISASAEKCDEAQRKIVDIIQNLSAISEENAASAQETTASMEELNANINVLADTAKDLKNLAENLNRDMDFFKM